MTREEFDKLKVGDKVIHAFGGIGVVTEKDEIGYTVKDKGFDCGDGLDEVSFAWYEGKLIKEIMESYEQKYKEALGWMKSLYGGLHGKTKEEAEKYFPELAESEDERIRKVQLDYWRSVGGKEWHGVPVQEVIAWLEKQGEQKPFDYENAMIIQKDFAPKEVTFTREVETGNGNIKALVTQKSPAESLGISPEKYEEIVNECIYGEAIPKFKVGDWLQYRNAKSFFVEEITKQGYVNGDSCLPFSWENEIHLWTIKDAKDGDILVNGSNIFIFSYLSDTRAMGYCHINLDDGKFYDDKGKNECFGLIDADFSPATKEQRDTLIKAMTDAGYTFDFEKKELKKIEQKLSNSAKIGKNDTILDLLNKMPSCITVDNISYHFVMKKTIAFMAFYEGEGAGYGKVVFWMAGEPIELLTAMLNKLKEEGLLDE